ncbi:thioredoxin-like [Dendropsophus ebraccatus]|uniref:thioredoxin-like n=1 Tax=Dendropsophus ebraccatus TaxID=150705 RepID=UPI003831A39D
MAIEHIQDKASMERCIQEAGGKLVVISFISPTCRYCRMLMTYLENLNQEMRGVIFRKVDINASPDLMDEYNIHSVPYTYLVKNGQLQNQVKGADEESLINRIMELKD